MPENINKVAFNLFILYLVSFFLHLPARIPFLGIIRFDMVLVAAICFYIFGGGPSMRPKMDIASRYLLSIFVFSIISLPLVEWPGSVIGGGLVLFIKGAIFYFFAVNLITTERRLKITIFWFVILNLIRVIEPLILNLATGYLGSRTHLGGGEFAGRLSGAPSDTINPNGLAFVIATIIPFLHYVFFPINKKTKVIYFLLLPVLAYVMMLTLSRSGVLALAIISFGIFLKSNRKFLLLVVGVTGVFMMFLSMNDIQKDRYLSLVSSDTRQSGSAEGRIEGWVRDFEVAMNRPIIGHGLGNSREANWNVAGKDQISHILWAEIWQEIGLIGLVIFILYLKVMITNFIKAGELVKNNFPVDSFLYRVIQAMQVWLLMNLLFSLASYGLKSYEWYFFGGLSVAVLSIVENKIANDNANKGPGAVQPVRSARYQLAEKINRKRRVT